VKKNAGKISVLVWLIVLFFILFCGCKAKKEQAKVDSITNDSVYIKAAMARRDSLQKVDRARRDSFDIKIENSFSNLEGKVDSSQIRAIKEDLKKKFGEMYK